jgi:Fe-S oxidoreductase
VHIITSLIVLVLLAVCLYFSLNSLLEILAMIRSGQKIDLFKQVPRRISAVIQYVFCHKKVLEDKSYGIMHIFYLYGFLILGIGHIELVLYGLTKFLLIFNISPFLYRNFLPDFLVKVIDFSQDFMAFFVLLMVIIALFRRIFIPKKRLLPRSRDAENILWLIGALYFSFFMYVPSELAFRSHSFAWYYPVSSLIAQGLIYVPPMFLQAFNTLGFWIHLSVFLGFMVYIPRSKHLHLIAAGPNIYYLHLDQVAKPSTIDFEKSESFGIDRVDKLTWKSLLDTFACTECGRCDAVCPASLTNKPLHPKKVLHDLKLNLRYENWPQLKKYHNLFGNVKKGLEEQLESLELNTPLINKNRDNLSVLPNGAYDLHGQIHLDDIWSCTTCAACVEVCPVLIDSVPTSLIEMRRNLVMMQASDYPKELNSSFKGMEIQKNPWGVGPDKREDWAKDLDVPLMRDKRETEYLFFVGCAGSTDDRAKKIQQALVRILKKANVDFAILGCEEKCTGDPARRMGNEYLFDTLAKENIEVLAKYKFKKIFSSCPHCFNSLKNEYRDFGTNYTVQHHSELINELFADGRLSIDVKNQLDSEITFHDPCYLGRYNKVYSAPREVIKNTVKNDVVEMSMNKQSSFCCGAGGGRMFMEEHIGKRINHERTEQAILTNAKTIATACPFCMTMMNDGVKDKGLGESIEVKDIAELVADRL